MTKISILKGNEAIENVGFGVIPVGETKKINLTLKNTSGNDLVNIQVVPVDKDMMAESVPVELKKGESAEFILKWSPDKDRDSPLEKDINIKATEVK